MKKILFLLLLAINAFGQGGRITPTQQGPTKYPWIGVRDNSIWLFQRDSESRILTDVDFSIAPSSVNDVSGFIRSTADKVVGPDGGVFIKRYGAVPVAGQGGIFFAGPFGTYYQRSYEGSTVYPEWWSSLVVNGDWSAAIQAAINYQNSLTGIGGVVRLASKTYTGVHDVKLKQNVSLIGTHNSANSASDSSGTVLKAPVTGVLYQNILSYDQDYSYPYQVSEQTGMNKSAPHLLIEGICFNGNNVVKHTVEITESWAVTLRNNKFVNANSYGLHIFDCNNINVLNNVISKFLFVSNADFNVNENEIVGSTTFPAFVCDGAAYGIVSGNKIYNSPSETAPYNFPVTDVDATGLFTTTQQVNLLGTDPVYVLSASANGGTHSFDVPTQKLTVNTTNGNPYRAVASTAAQLVVGKSYRLQGTILLRSGSASSSRTIQFIPGNETQVYGSVTANNNTSLPVDITFTFNPTGYFNTSALKFYITQQVGTSGTDIIDFSNFTLTAAGGLSDQLDKTPVVLSYLPGITGNIRNNYPASKPYYIKWVSGQTFRLADSYSNYVNNVWVTPVAPSTGLTNFTVSVPNAVLAIVGNFSAGTTYTANKIEDVETAGILFKGASYNVLTGNTIMKSNYAQNPVLVRFESGSSENAVTGNLIANRILTGTMDKTWKCIYLDATSGNNVFSGIVTGNAKSIDIEDNFVGTQANQNKYDAITLKNSFIKRIRETDYKTPVARGLTVVKDLVNGMVHTAGVLTGEEFTIQFDDLIFNGNTDVTFFQQHDGTAQSGRIAIKRNSGRQIYITIEGTVVFTTSETVENATPANITVTRDALYNYSVYINGVASVPSVTATVTNPIPTGGSVKTSVGRFSPNPSEESYSIRRFRIFSDALSATEVATLNAGGLLDNADYATLSLNSLADSTTIFSGSTGVTISGVAGGAAGRGVQLSLSSSSHYARLATIANSVTKTIRMSFYVKSDVNTGMLINRGSYSSYLPVTTAFTKKVVYLKPDFRNGNLSSEQLNMVFGSEAGSVYGGAFTKAGSGTIVMDNIQVWSNPLIAIVDLDFTKMVGGSSMTNAVPSVFQSWSMQNYAYQPIRNGFSYGSAVPTVGTWKVNDSVINTAPTATTPYMWVCVTAGTPGTWAALYLFNPTTSQTYTATQALSSGATFNTALVTSAASIPTTGTYTKGDEVMNSNPSELGTAASKYIVRGWKRMVTGSAHVLGTDWLEMRALTGN